MGKSEQFNRYKRVGYKPDIMRYTACLVVKPVIVDVYAFVFNTHFPSGPCLLINWARPFPILGVSGVRFHFYFEQIFLLTNSEDPNQTQRSAASDLGLHCLHMSQKLGR